MKAQKIIAEPETIRLKEDGYYLTSKIVQGPTNFLDRRVSVRLTSKQLDAICQWDTETSDTYILSLDSPEGGAA